MESTYRRFERQRRPTTAPSWCTTTKLTFLLGVWVRVRVGVSLGRVGDRSMVVEAEGCRAVFRVVRGIGQRVYVQKNEKTDTPNAAALPCRVYSFVQRRKIDYYTPCAWIHKRSRLQLQKKKEKEKEKSKRCIAGLPP